MKQLAIVLIFAAMAGAKDKPERRYHRISIAEMAQDEPADWNKVSTHVELFGWVRYVAHEDDGDLHIRICEDPRIEGMDRKHCIVAECTPWLKCRQPRVGAKVLVRGISRYDAESPGHHWWECHPVERLQVIK